MYFEDRSDGGKQLAAKLMKYKKAPNSIVIGLPRGGVITAFEVAKTLELPLDIIVSRKIGTPDNPEFALGAITEDGNVFLDKDLIQLFHVQTSYLDRVIEEEKKEAARRHRLYRKGRSMSSLIGKTVIIVDDGVATGATIKAAIHAAKARGAQKIIIAVPVAPTEFVAMIRKSVDAVVVVREEDNLGSVGAFYANFAQTSDEEVIQALHSH